MASFQLELSYWLHGLGEIARTQGRFDEARGLHLRSLAIRDKVLPADSRILVGTIRALAVMADAEGRYADAAKAYERLVKIAADDANMARTFEGLANSYYGLGLYRDAEPVYKRALEMTEKAHGPDPHVAGILNNLANLYEAQGRYFDVEPLHKRALAIREKHLGPDHEDVAASLHNLADLYQNLGRFQEAQQLEKRALDIKEKTLGPNHGAFGQSLMVLAHIYGSLGRYEDAEPLIRRAVAIYEKMPECNISGRWPELFKRLRNFVKFRVSTTRRKISCNAPLA